MVNGCVVYYVMCAVSVYHRLSSHGAATVASVVNKLDELS